MEFHKDQPQLVIDQVRDVVEAVRAGRTELELWNQCDA